MLLNFTKIHGAGNDFIVVDDFAGQIELESEQVKALCDRHFGIGADGVILVRPSSNSDCTAFMHYINADGSLAEMCGNGVRCFAKFLVDNGFVALEEGATTGSFVADTLSGKKQISFETDVEGKLTRATVDMGEPVFEPERIPTSLRATREIAIKNSSLVGDENAPAVVQEFAPTATSEADPAAASPVTPPASVPTVPAVVQAVVSTAYESFPVTCVNMGNPHAVLFIKYHNRGAAKAFADDSASYDILPIGASLESNTRYFPQKINVEFAAQIAQNHIRMRVYERGVGETLACGTGACATAVVAIILGLATRDKAVVVELPGGTLDISWQENNHVILSGPAQTVYTGTVKI